MENLSPEESLRVIQTMIDKTKTSVADKSFYFLLWGWLVLIGSLLQYFLFVIVKTPQHGAAWSIMFVGVIVSIVRGAKEKSGPVKTYIDEGLTSIWICLFIVQMLIVFVFAVRGGWEYCYTAFITEYSIGCFLTGRLLKFPPLVWGAIFCWALAILTVFADMPTNMLIMAAAIGISYIIPGHRLRSEYKNQIQKQPE